MKSADIPDIQPVMPPFLAPAVTVVAWIAFSIAVVGTVLLVITILRQDDSARTFGSFVIAIGGVFLALVLAIAGISWLPFWLALAAIIVGALGAGYAHRRLNRW